MAQSSGAGCTKKEGGLISQVLYQKADARLADHPRHSCSLGNSLKPLISRGFAVSRRRSVNSCRAAAKSSLKPPEKKISLAKFSFGITLWVGRNASGSKKESQMAWKAPKIVEVPVGMEINMYACAARK
jgi:coenzyme PQQ precursor peptide PqqA